jgi:hypothetical protein
MPITDTLSLSLVRSPDDAASFSPTYQAELRHFFNLVRAGGMKISAAAHAADSIGGGGFTGEFFVAMVQVIGPAFRRATVAWMHGRPGRTARVKLGNTDVVAANSIELHGLFDLIIAVEQRHDLFDSGNERH